MARLKPPVFQVHAGQSLLGSWQKEYRTLSFSEYLLAEGSEYELGYTLRHEMAHQYVDEYLHRKDNRPHGEAFVQACQLLGISHSASMKLDPKGHKMADKIRKLLQLALSDNPHEAGLASRRARELMEKHRIEPETNPFLYHHLARFGARRRAADRSLIALLTRHFSVYSIWIQSPKVQTGDVAWHVEIMGLRHHIEIAAYAFDFLVREMETRWRAFRKKGVTSSGDKRSFQLGLLAGLDRQLTGQPELPNGDYSLLVLEKKALLAFVASRYPRLSQRSGRASLVSNTYNDGFHEGSKLQIRDGIPMQNEPRMLTQ